MEKSKKYTWQYFIIFAIAIIVRGMGHLGKCSFYFRTDDFGPLIYPATLAGLDWREYIEQVHFYYGYGYYWIFTPLFYFMKSFKDIYVTILVINTVLICMIPMLVYRIETKYLKLEKNWVSMLLAVSASFFVGDNPMPSRTTWCRTDNEIPMYFFVWLLIAVVLAVKECEDKKKKILLSVCLGLLLVWGLTVHERVNALMLAVIASMIYVFICKRKWIFNPIALIGSLGCGIMLHKVVRKAICAYYWTSGVKNTNAYRTSFFFLKSLAGFRAFCTIIVGNIHSLLIKTYGLPVIAIVVLLFWIFNNGIISSIVNRKKNKQNQQQGKNAVAAIENDELIMMIFGIAFIIIVVGLSMNWGRKLTIGFAKGEVVSNYKAICYSRYYYPVCGPLVVSTVAFLNTKRESLKKILVWSFGMLTFLEGIFFIFVYGLMSKGEGKQYITRAQNIRVIKNAVDNFWFGTILMFVLLFLIIVLVYKNTKIKPIHVIVLLMLIYNVAFRVRIMDLDNIQLKIKGDKVVYDFMEMAENVDYDLEGKIYLKETDHQMNYVQLILMDQTIHRGLPEEGQEAVVFTNTMLEELQTQGYVGIKHGTYYVMTNIPEYIPVLEELETEK